MPASVEDLERGAVCLALYPFTLGFPLDAVVRDAESELQASIEKFEDIEGIEKTIEPGDVPEAATKLKLRRVVLLQTGTDERRNDVMVARVNSLPPGWQQTRKKWYERVSTGKHPTILWLSGEPHHGSSGKESYVNLISVGPIEKNAILRRTGGLTDDEMRDASTRLVTSLELDLSDD